MRTRDKLAWGTAGLAAFIGSFIPSDIPAHAATDIYIENSGVDSNDGFSPTTPVKTIDRAHWLAVSGANQDEDYTYNLHLGDGTFTQEQAGTLNFYRNWQTINITGNGPDNTKLNAAMVASGPMSVSDLSSEGMPYNLGLLVRFKDEGSLQNCLLTDNASTQLDNNGELVTADDCTFRDIDPAFFVQSMGKEGEASQGFNISGSLFDTCLPYRLGTGVFTVDTGDNAYVNCDPIAESSDASGTDAEINFSKSFFQGSGKTGNNYEGPCPADTGITNPSALEGLVDNVSNARFDNPLRFPPFPLPDDTYGFGDMDGDTIPNYLDFDIDGDGVSNDDEIYRDNTDPYCLFDVLEPEHIPASSPTSLAVLAGALLAGGVYAGSRRREAYSSEAREARD